MRKEEEEAGRTGGRRNKTGMKGRIRRGDLKKREEVEGDGGKAEIYVRKNLLVKKFST